MGNGDYKPDNFKRHLEELTGYDFFRYVILKNSNGSLFGVFEARSLKYTLMDPKSTSSLDGFIANVNGATEDDRKGIKGLKHFISIVDAVRSEDKKSNVLEKMQTTKRSWLPVVDSNSNLAGVVNESRLTASMILDINRKLRDTSA